MQIFFYRENKKKREIGREEETKKIYTYILPERVLVRDLIEDLIAIRTRNTKNLSACRAEI